tara:strand:- start:155 stop:2692 length:2538 start_codon:yes stop_codon:yes gene_type:complete
MTKMTIIDFCEKNSIAWRPIKLNIISNEDGTTTKKLAKINNKYPKLTDFRDEEFITGEMLKLQKNFLKASSSTKDTYHIALDTMDIYHLDVDWLTTKLYSNESKALVESFSKSCPYYKSTTKELGKHLLFKLDKKLAKQNTKFVGGDLYADLEVLSGIWGWSKWDAEIFNDELEIPTLNREEFPFPKTYTVKKSPKLKFNMKPKKTILTDEIKNSSIFKFCDLIDVKYLDNYSDWIRILWSLKTENHYEIAKYISQKSNKYKETDFDTKWNGLSPTTITIGSVKYYSQISNIKEYRKLQLEQFEKWEYDFLDSDDTLAKIFLENNEADIIYINHIIYIFRGDTNGDNGRWFIDEKLERIKLTLGNYLSDLFIDYKILLSVNAKDEEDEDKKEENKKKIDNINKLIKMLKNVSKINSVCDKLKQLLSVKDFSEIKFDNNGLLFPFNNTCYDLKTHNWIGTRRSNYILETSGYNWIEPTDEEVKIVADLIDEIFPIKSIKQEYIHFMTTCLYGIPIEKFIIANGDGGNGKGVINELLGDTCGDFGYNGNNSVLLNPIGEGGNPAIANMSKKRLICYREPDEKKAINLSSIKELTGGKQISARKLYSNDDNTILCGTHILECNKKLSMVGNLDNSIHRRIRDIPFVATYTTDEKQLELADELNYIRKANPYYKSIQFQKKHKFALFKYLINYAKKWEGEKNGKNVCEELYKSTEVDIRTKKYIEDNDYIYNVLREKYVLDTSNKFNFMKIKDFWLYFKDSDFYKTLSKHEQNKVYSYNQILDHLKTTTSTKLYYKDRYQIKDKIGVSHNLKNILRFWRHKTDAELLEEQNAEEELLFINDDDVDTDEE